VHCVAIQRCPAPSLQLPIPKGPKRPGSAVVRPRAGSCPSALRSAELQARMLITGAVISSGIYAAKGLCKGEGGFIKETSRERPRLR